jgi:hypothetical protein
LPALRAESLTAGGNTAARRTAASIENDVQTKTYEPRGGSAFILPSSVIRPPLSSVSVSRRVVPSSPAGSPACPSPILGGWTAAHNWRRAIEIRGVVTIQIVRLSRQELYDLVWSEPMRKVAARFQLSDVGLKKICTKHRIPVPARGYWRRIETGQSPPKIALPKLVQAGKIEIRVKPKEVKMALDAELGVVPNAAEAAAKPIRVPDTLERPHAATRALQAALKGMKPDKYGAIHSTVADAFLVRLHPDSKDRVLRIADAFVKACDGRGFELRRGNDGSRYAGQLRVVVEGEDFEFSIDERMRQEPYQMTAEEVARRKRGGYVYTPRYQYVPTGMLTIKVGPGYGSGLPQSWTDSRNQKLEERLGEVVLALRRLSAWRIVAREKRQLKEQRVAREQQRRADLRERIEAERKAISRLEEEARNWRRAEEIRAFVAARRDAIQSDTTWATWALEQADRIDPLRASPHSILDTPQSECREVSTWEFDKYADEPEPE